ncbi:TetR family transcriptional regulator [Streptomyces sp. KL116D]|uniref:TetR/AcrR family transcriptional regulator n=1 Tax=Streptomyces sp. KL116D TaxID=3045152 RepID=UPI003557F6BD
MRSAGTAVPETTERKRLAACEDVRGPVVRGPGRGPHCLDAAHPPPSVSGAPRQEGTAKDDPRCRKAISPTTHSMPFGFCLQGVSPGNFRCRRVLSMAQRGSCAKGIAKREEILSTALDLVARVGYSRTTVREIAQAVGLSQTGLLHYFGARNSSSSRSCAAAARSTSKCSAWSTTQADPHWPTCHARSPRWHATMPKFRGSSSSTHASPPKRPSPKHVAHTTSVTATPSSVLRRQPRSGSTRPTAPSLPPWTPDRLCSHALCTARRPTDPVDVRLRDRHGGSTRLCLDTATEHT